jgi:hypothetical protein
MPSVMTRYMRPRNIRDRRASSPLEKKEDKARLYSHFLPYDGLWMASDKVLGRLIL